MGIMQAQSICQTGLLMMLSKLLAASSPRHEIIHTTL